MTRWWVVKDGDGRVVPWSLSNIGSYTAAMKAAEGRRLSWEILQKLNGWHVVEVRITEVEEQQV